MEVVPFLEVDDIVRRVNQGTDLLHGCMQLVVESIHGLTIHGRLKALGFSSIQVDQYFMKLVDLKDRQYENTICRVLLLGLTRHISTKFVRKSVD